MTALDTDYPPGKKRRIPAATILDNMWDSVREENPTPLRLRELEASEAKLRELAAKRSGVSLTSFTLTIRDIDLETFTYDVCFVPPIDPESAQPMSTAERLGGLVLEYLAGLLERAVKDMDNRRSCRPSIEKG